MVRSSLKSRTLLQRIIRGWAIYSIGCVAVALVLAVGYSLWGRWDWARTQRDLRAKGEKLSLVELAPAAIADADNFYADPLWLELRDNVAVRYPNGTVSEARVKKGDRQIDRLDRILTEEERAGMQVRYPEFKIERNIATTCAGIMTQVREKTLAEQMRGAECVLALQEFQEPVLSRLLVLTQRAHGRFPIDYAAGFGPFHPEVEYFGSIELAWQIRWWALNALGRRDEAFGVLLAIVRYGETIKDEPALIDFLVRVATTNQSLKVVELALAGKNLTDGQLLVLQHTLAAIDLRPQLLLSLRGERGGLNHTMEEMRDGGDSLRLNRMSLPYRAIWLAADQAHANRRFQEQIELIQDVASGKPVPAGLKIPRDEATIWNHLLYPVSSVNGPNLDNIFQQTLWTQTRVEQVRVGCALERYRLVHSVYPEVLMELIPDYLAERPKDLLSQASMRYRRSKDGSFVLWGVGWDDRKEGDEPTAGDWAWVAGSP